MGTFEDQLHKMSTTDVHAVMKAALSLAQGGNLLWRDALLDCASTIVKDELNNSHREITALYRTYFVPADTYFQIVQQCCPGVVRFLNGVTKRPSRNITDDQLLITLEHLYGIANDNFIGPLCFAKHIVLYAITGSKRLGQVLNAAGPYASYCSVLRFIQEITQQKLLYPALCKGDIIAVIDNAQYVGRWWDVAQPQDQKKLSTVMTATILLIPNGNSRLQEQESLSPSKWLQLAPENMVAKLLMRRLVLCVSDQVSFSRTPE